MISDTEDTVDTAVAAGSIAEQESRADQEGEPNENAVEEDGKVSLEENRTEHDDEEPVVIAQITRKPKKFNFKSFKSSQMSQARSSSHDTAENDLCLSDKNRNGDLDLGGSDDLKVCESHEVKEKTAAVSVESTVDSDIEEMDTNHKTTDDYLDEPELQAFDDYDMNFNDEMPDCCVTVNGTIIEEDDGNDHEKDNNERNGNENKDRERNESNDRNVDKEMDDMEVNNDEFDDLEDGVLNRVMDEIEGVEKAGEDVEEDYDPPTDVSMNVSTVDVSLNQPDLMVCDFNLYLLSF